MTSCTFSTTHIVEASLRGSEQIGQTSVSLILWHTLQYFTSRRKCLIESANWSAFSIGSRNIYRARRNAVLRPIPGSLDNESTARSKSFEGKAVSNLYFFCIFMIPGEEPHKGNDKNYSSTYIRDCTIKSHCLITDKQEYRTDNCHKQRWNKRYYKRFVLLNKVHSDSPKSKHAKRLVTPSEILPYSLKSIRIFDLPNKQQYCRDKHRYTYTQTFANSFLVNMYKLCYNKTGTTKRCIATCNRCCDDTKNCKYTAEHSKPTLANILHYKWSIEKLP